MMRVARAAFYFAAVLQFLLAGACLFYVGVFLIGGGTNDELGLLQVLRWPFIVTGAIGALLTYGGIRTWRMANRWWWPLAVAVVAIPLVFIILFVLSGVALS